MNKIIGIYSAKGGVGKTTSAINISYALNSFGRNTLLVDTDLTSPNLGIYLGVGEISVSLNKVLKGEVSIKNAIYRHISGLNVIFGSIRPNNKEGIDFSKIDEALKEVRDEFDITIIDTAPGQFESSLRELKSMESILIVTTPEMAAVTDALRTITIARENKKHIIGVILTRVNQHEHEMKKENIEALLNSRVLACIPEDKNVPLSAKIGSPIASTHPNSEITVKYKKLAAKIIGGEYKLVN